MGAKRSDRAMRASRRGSSLTLALLCLRHFGGGNVGGLSVCCPNGRVKIADFLANGRFFHLNECKSPIPSSDLKPHKLHGTMAEVGMSYVKKMTSIKLARESLASGSLSKQIP